MKKRINIMLFIAIILLPLQAHALFSTLIESSTSVANNLIDSSESSTSQMIALTTQLSSDIGTMSDRILLMADNIDKMADKIGVMADRIVTTEDMMTDTLTRMEEIAMGRNSTTQNGAVLLLTPYGSYATSNEAPIISLSNYAPNYLLYVSQSPRINAVSSSSVMISDTVPLARVWPDITAGLENSKIYIAVKTIDGDTLSDISNAVLINLN